MKAPIARLAATALVLAGAAPALAATAQQAQQISIEHRDLNLSAPQGQAVLDQRICKAARAVCAAVHPATGTRVRSSEATQCYRAAKAQALTQVVAATAAQQRGG